MFSRHSLQTASYQHRQSEVSNTSWGGLVDETIRGIMISIDFNAFSRPLHFSPVSCIVVQRVQRWRVDEYSRHFHACFGELDPIDA